MFQLKNFRKAIVCFLCCIACLFSISSVSALSANSIPNSITSVPMAPGVSLDNLATASEGHLVSVVHRTASYGSTVIGNLENGTKVTVLGTKGSFYKIDCYDMNGYISKTQVSKNESGEYYVNCNPKSSESKYLKGYTPKTALELKSQLMAVAKKYIGVTYVWGGTTPKGFDCSGLVQYVFKAHGITLPRTSKEQWTVGTAISKSQLKVGDLVFFANTYTTGVSHVGIYVGNNQFIHASSSQGVTISSLSNSYWAAHYHGCRRVL